MNYSSCTVKQADQYSAMLKTGFMKKFFNILERITKTKFVKCYISKLYNISKSLNRRFVIGEKKEKEKEKRNVSCFCLRYPLHQ